MLAAAGMMFTGCTLWDDQWTECTPLPETEIPVTPEPWDPQDEQNDPVGD